MGRRAPLWKRDRSSSRMARVAPSEQKQPCMSSAVAVSKLQTIATQQDQEDQE